MRGNVHHSEDAKMIIKGKEMKRFMQACNGLPYNRKFVYYSRGFALSRFANAEKVGGGFVVESDKEIPVLSRFKVTYKQYLRLTRELNPTKQEPSKPIKQTKYKYIPYKGKK